MQTGTQVRRLGLKCQVTQFSSLLACMRCRTPPFLFGDLVPDGHRFIAIAARKLRPKDWQDVGQFLLGNVAFCVHVKMACIWPLRREA